MKTIMTLMIADMMQLTRTTSNLLGMRQESIQASKILSCVCWGGGGGGGGGVVFIKLHIIAQSGPVILVILCHLH